MLTQERLKELLHYDPETGKFLWLVDKGSRAKAGALAGRVDGSGYRGIRIDGTLYYAHRLAVLYMTGSWPEDEVDHRQPGREFRDDNRWSQIRVATGSQNNANQGLPANNTSGAKGVHWHKGAGKWMVQVKVHGTQRYLGLYEDFKVACEVRRTAARATFGEFARER